MFATCSSAYLDGRDFVGVNRHGCEYFINVISYSFRCGRLSRRYFRSYSSIITITMFKPCVSIRTDKLQESSQLCVTSGFMQPNPCSCCIDGLMKFRATRREYRNLDMNDSSSISPQKHFEFVSEYRRLGCHPVAPHTQVHTQN